METELANLNHHDTGTRLAGLQALMEMANRGDLELPPSNGFVNNHIHTTYSFSPYSPTKAVWMAKTAGLTTAGIMDHDSISGAGEFIEAGKIAGIATTIGVECRVDFSETRLAGKRINNPDQISNAYVSMHGIPHGKIEEVKAFFSPLIQARNERNRLMVENINDLVKREDLRLDLERDVLPVSWHQDGGTVTERHLLFALAGKLVAALDKGQNLVSFLKEKLNLKVIGRMEELLMDVDNRLYEYDLLGVLKSDMVEKIYIDAHAECPDVREFIEFTKSAGAITAYAYLGDVGESVTGDKKSQKFEDDYIDLVFDEIKELGFQAVTYMPTRNSLEQLARVKDICNRYGFFQICGEDINSPRQSFVCEVLKNPEFVHLIQSTWALIGHELEATINADRGLFSPAVVRRHPDLQERVAVFEKIGRKHHI